MPKLTAPSLPPGPRQTLSLELHTLHRRAGWPSVRDLSRALGDGVASPSRIHDAFTKPRLPSWGLLDVLVTELARRVPRADPTGVSERFHGLWETAAEASSAPLTSEGAIAEETAEDQPFREAFDQVVVNYYGPTVAPPADVQEAMWAAGRESQRQQHMPEPIIRGPYEPTLAPPADIQEAMWAAGRPVIRGSYERTCVTDERVLALLRMSFEERAEQVPYMRLILRLLRAQAEAFREEADVARAERLISGDISALQQMLDEIEPRRGRSVDLTEEDPGRQIDLTAGERPSSWDV
ncbi:hypothetical protein ACFY8F_40520 [Streptomyces tanashiensis]|uniref:hypothetical protein n=1 Tax=Streptomyces tanashiensis TaxID=67367 RepID=UPI0036CBC5A8